MANDNIVVNALLPVLNDILGIREQLAYIHRLYRVTRTYAINGIDYTDVEAEITPVPKIDERKRDVDVHGEGTTFKGDLSVKAISKATYTMDSQLQTISNPQSNVIYLYRYNGDYYTVAQLKECLLTWEMELVKYNG